MVINFNEFEECIGRIADLKFKAMSLKEKLKLFMKEILNETEPPLEEPVVEPMAEAIAIQAPKQDMP